MTDSKDKRLGLSARRFATLGEKSSMSTLYVGHLGIGSNGTGMPTFVLAV